MISKVFIVIPTYNEKENIERLIKKIFALNIDNLRIIIIDDNSQDGTGQLAKKLAKTYPITVIQRPQKIGLGSAYITGFARALNNGADLICQMDADFSHHPQDVPALIQACRDGVDLALGSRRIGGGKIIGWNWWRKFCSWNAMSLSRTILNLKTRDVTTGFRCFRRDALEKIKFQNIKTNGYAWLEEMIYLAEKNNLKIKEVPVTFIDRKFGQSKLGWSEIWEFFVTLVKLRLCRYI